MNNDNEILLATALRFFGAACASVSHEIKNSLAIMRENAGLMEDLLMMAEKGVPLDTERLRSLAVRINKQTERADQIVKNLNQFAHSVDEPLASVEFAEHILLVCSLAQRLASLKGVSFKLRSSEESVVLETAPFFLANMIWQCLLRAIEGGGGQKDLELEVGGEGDAAELNIRGIKALPGNCSGAFPGQAEMLLAECLKAYLSFDPTSGVIRVTLPRRIKHLPG